MRFAIAGTIVGRGGIQTHCYWLTRLLASEGHEVLFFAMAKSPQLYHHERFDELRSLPGVTIKHAYVDSNGVIRSSIGTTFDMVGRLRDFAPEVFFACGTGWNLFLPALLLSSKCRKVFHEVMSGERFTFSDSRWIASFAFSDIAAQATAVAENFKKAFCWKKLIKVLPAFPEPLELVAKLPDATRRIVPMGEAKAAFFSRLVPHKQGYWLVKNWSKLSDSIRELHIFGTGPEEELIRHFIEENDLRSRIVLRGEYPNGQAYVDLLSSFDMTLLPTIGAEGAPLVLLESLSCGVPFVSIDVGGIADYANPDSIIVKKSKIDTYFGRVHELSTRLRDGTVDQGACQKFYFEHFSNKSLNARWIDYLTSR
jgi:glycosyltransferase involved in cell wall biosynthesis